MDFHVKQCRHFGKEVAEWWQPLFIPPNNSLGSVHTFLFDWISDHPGRQEQVHDGDRKLNTWCQILVFPATNRTKSQRWFTVVCAAARLYKHHIPSVCTSRVYYCPLRQTNPSVHRLNTHITMTTTHPKVPSQTALTYSENSFHSSEVQLPLLFSLHVGQQWNHGLTFTMLHIHWRRLVLLSAVSLWVLPHKVLSWLFFWHLWWTRHS